MSKTKKVEVTEPRQTIRFLKSARTTIYLAVDRLKNVSVTRFIRAAKTAAEAIANSSMSEAPHVPLSRVCDGEFVGQPVVTTGVVGSLGNREMFRYHSGKQATIRKRSVAEISISDGKTDIKCGVINDDGFNQKLRENIGEQLKFYGTVIEIPKSKTRSFYSFIIEKIRPIKDAIDIVRPTAEEAKAVDEFLEEHTGKEIFDFIKSEIVALCRIVGLSTAVHLNTLVDFVIYISLSGGKRIGNAPSMLHLWIIGPPGVGKKLLSMALNYLSPVFHEAQPGKIALPGISAAAVRGRDGNWSSVPGFIPRSHLGAFSMQDYHSVDRSMRKALVGVFSMVMEEGFVIDATVAKTKFKAETSIVLDINRLSHVHTGMTALRGTSADLSDIPRHIQTRFDTIVEIPEDPERQFLVAREMIGQSGSTEKIADERKRIRFLKVLVATLRNRNTEMIFTDGAIEHLGNVVEKFYAENKENLSALEALADFQTRGTNSTLKIAAAVARSHDRSNVEKSDVEVALRYLFLKYEFLKSTISEISTEALSKPLSLSERTRRKWIVKTFSSQTVTAAKVLAALQAQFDPIFCPGKRTIYRDLKHIATKGKKGTFVVGKYQP